jgi:hypothetical protein
MKATLFLECASLPDEELQRLTRDLSFAVNRETDVAAILPEGRAEPGARGDAGMLYTLLLTFVTSGAAVAMFEVVKAFFERNVALKLTLKRGDGQELIIDQTNMRADQFDATLDLARKFFGGAT